MSILSGTPSYFCMHFPFTIYTSFSDDFLLVCGNLTRLFESLFGFYSYF